MLEILMIAFGSLTLIPLCIFYIISRRTYLRYKLLPYKINELISLFGTLYIIFTLFASFVPLKIISFFFFNIAIVLVSIMVILSLAYFRILRVENLSTGVISLYFLLISIKIVSLVIDPLKVYRYNNIYMREGHLSTIALIAPIIALLLLIIEIALLYKQTRTNPKKKKYSRYILSAYIWVMILIPTYWIGMEFRLISILIPYLQALLISIIVLSLSIFFYHNPEKLILLPVHIKGFLLHTYGGLAIIKKPLDEVFRHSIALSSSLVASIIGLETAIEELREIYLFRVHKLIETTIIMFFGRITVGTFILNKDNSVIRAILRKIVLEFERTVGYIDEGMITDEEISLAEKILDKYIEFLS